MENNVKSMTGEELIEKYNMFVHKMANPYTQEIDRLPWVSFEDVEQAARIGLLKAQKSFDPERSDRFLTYAAHFMKREIQNCLGMRWRDGGYKRQPIVNSLDEPITSETETTLKDLIEDDSIESVRERIETSADVIKALEVLNPVEREIIESLYLKAEPDTIAQVAAKMNHCMPYVTDHRRKAFKKLKRLLSDYAELQPHHISLNSYKTHFLSEQELYLLLKEQREENILNQLNRIMMD